MSAATSRTLLTEAEYLEIERAAETRSEYYQGEVFAMAGASRQHGRIVVNLAAALSQRLAGGPCEVFANDLRVKVAETGVYAYPDLVVACEDQQYLDEELDTLLNPVAIVEVLSPSTEWYDRNGKFASYQQLPSLQEYVLVAQDRMRVEQYRRGKSGEWLQTVLEDSEAALELGAGGVVVTLHEIYARMEFPGIGNPAGRNKPQ